jgi:general secretion pathway protein G
MTGDRKPFGRRSVEGGFTLVELLVVLAVLSLLAGLAASVAVGRVRQSKESALKADLRNLRKALDDFAADKGKYPVHLSDLVDARYLREMPKDPITDSDGTWRPVLSKDPVQPEGIVDVRSGSDERSSEGDLYADW